jgi:hypothetical protein
MPALTHSSAIDHMSGVRGMPIMGNITKQRLWPWLTIAMLCALEATALGVFAYWHLSRAALWYDESMQFWMSLGLDGFGAPQTPPGGFIGVIRNNAIANLDPGGFTIIMWLWLKIATGVIWQRTLPFIFFLFGVACFGWLGWTRRRSMLFAVFSSLIPACDPLILDYATEVRAYSMEFAGIALGCVLLDKLTFHRQTLLALFTGIVFALFLGSRYSFGLFAAAAFFALAVITFADTSIDRRQGAMRLAAFAAPIAIAAAVIAVVAFLPQYKTRMSPDQGAYLQYFAASTAAGKSWDYLFAMLARNLLGPYGIALTLAALLGAAWLTRCRRLLGIGEISLDDAMFGLLSLATIVISALVWRWHPWDMTQKWSLWLHALSAVAIVRLISSVLAWAAPPSASAFETDARLAAVVGVGVLALDLRLATYRRAGNNLVPVLAFLERAAPAPGSIAVEIHWYPTLRYFYEYGAFAGSPLYPSAFRLPNWTGPKPLVYPQTCYLVTPRTLEQARAFFKGYNITRDPDLPDQLFRVEPIAAAATHTDD